MKRIAFLLVMLLSLKSIAQTPTVTLGDIPPSTFVNGRVNPSKTTSSRIIANGKLTANSAQYEIMSYSVSIMKGRDLWGPVNVKGSALTPAIIDQIKKTKGPGVKVFF